MNAPDVFALGGTDAELPATPAGIAAIEFEPTDMAKVLSEGLSAESIQALAIDLRLAAVTVSRTKAELVEMVHKMRTEGDEDIYFEMVDSFADTLGRLEGLLKMVKAAHTRCLIAASVVAIADEGSAS
jgi:hypothetical protein